MKCAFSAHLGSQSVATFRIAFLSKYVIPSCTWYVDSLSTYSQNVQLQINFQVNHTFNQSKVFLPDVCELGYIKNQDNLNWKQYFQCLGVTVI